MDCAWLMASYQGVVSVHWQGLNLSCPMLSFKGHGFKLYHRQMSTFPLQVAVCHAWSISTRGSHFVELPCPYLRHLGCLLSAESGDKTLTWDSTDLYNILETSLEQAGFPSTITHFQKIMNVLTLGITSPCCCLIVYISSHGQRSKANMLSNCSYVS